MTRARPIEAAMAAGATVTALLPLTSLFRPVGDLWPILFIVAVVAVCGIVLRMLWRSVILVGLGQLVIASVVLAWFHSPAALSWGLPTRDLFTTWNSLLLQGIDTIQRYSAPAPTSPGVILGLCLIAAAVAIVVDLLGVSLQNPAVAGLPLLTAYLVSAANASSGLHPFFFLAAALAWLILVAHQGTGILRRWGGLATSATPESGGSMSLFTTKLAGSGRRLGFATVALALLLPTVLPSLPERYLFDGLSRSSAGTGNGGSVSLSSSFDIANSLADQSTQPVLKYTTDAAQPGPLRVGIFDMARGGANLTWRARSTSSDSAVFPATDPTVLVPSVPTATRRITVTENQVAAPSVALPQPLSAFGSDEDGWALNSDGDVVAGQSMDSYAANFAEATPTEEQLHAGGEVSEGTVPADLQIDPGSQAYLRELSAQIIPEGADPIDTARAILDYLQQPEFTYSLDLAPVQPGQSRNPLIHFLETKTGYCIQYSSAMIMLARVNGIPARMAVGFLPGTLGADDARTVIASDAHAWPELRLPGVGWLRFEPTPSSHAGTGPAWSDAPSSTPDNPSQSATTEPSSSASAVPTPSASRPEIEAAQGPGSTTDSASWWTSIPTGIWLILVAIAGVLGALGMPLLARLQRRRTVHAAATDAERIEAEWQSLMHHVEDLGLSPPPGTTPRQSIAHLRRVALLDEQDSTAVQDVVQAVEQARYAPPTSTMTLPDVTLASRHVRSALDKAAPAKRRARALLWPSEGLALLRSTADRVRGAARWGARRH